MKIFTVYTVIDLITAPALINAPMTFYFIFTYYRPLDDLFPDYLLYFHLLSPTWRSFGTGGREQIYVSAPGTYYVEYGNLKNLWLILHVLLLFCTAPISGKKGWNAGGSGRPEGGTTGVRSLFSNIPLLIQPVIDNCTESLIGKLLKA